MSKEREREREREREEAWTKGATPVPTALAKEAWTKTSSEES